MKLIPLTYGQFAKVSDEDYDFLIQWKWYAKKSSDKKSYYATRSDTSRGRKNTKAVLMHRLLLGLTDSKQFGDHIDNDSLNNCRDNLRVVTPSQNSMNKRSKCNSASKFLGVYKIESMGKSGIGDKKYIKSYGYRWYAIIMVNKKRIRTCYPYTPCGELAAAITYDQMASKYFGEFANLNFKSFW